SAGSGRPLRRLGSRLIPAGRPGEAVDRPGETGKDRAVGAVVAPADPRSLCLGKPMATEPNPAPATPALELFGSRQFTAWLAEQRVSLAFSTYQTGKLFLIGLQPDGRLSIFERTFNRCMGLWADGQTLWMTSLFQLWRFENYLPPGQTAN